jgi:hypothetical protein
VTAQNIANVDTPGYSQKEVAQGPKEVTDGAALFFNGVEVTEIRRAYDVALTRRISVSGFYLDELQVSGRHRGERHKGAKAQRGKGTEERHKVFFFSLCVCSIRYQVGTEAQSFFLFPVCLLYPLSGRHKGAKFFSFPCMPLCLLYP